MKKLVGVAVTLLVAFAACDDFASPTDQGPGPGPADADLTLQKISGDQQTGAPGQELDAPYVVKAVDEAGGAVSGVTVRFRIQDDDGGSLSSSSVVTDSDGNANVTARLPDEMDATQSVVALSDSAQNQVSFTSQTAAPDFTLQKIEGDNQLGAPGAELPDPYVVKLVDDAGGAVPGVTVRFRIEEGNGGSLTSSSVVTDSAGQAQVGVRLPPAVDADQTVQVSSDSSRNSVSFLSQTTPQLSGPASIRIISGDAQKGIERDTLLDPLRVEVTNRDGVALEGVSVRWLIASGDGGGAVLGSPTTTDADGIATNRWRLGDIPQSTDSLAAFIHPSDAEPDTVRFTATVTGVPDTIVVTQGGIELDNNFKEPEVLVGDTVFAAPGHWSRQPFKAIVRDAAGDSVRGARLSWTVTSRSGAVGDEPQGGSAETVTVITDEEGGITVWRMAPALDELADIAPECVTEDGDGNLILDPSFDCWIGATLSLERYPEVTPVTLDALLRED